MVLGVDVAGERRARELEARQQRPTRLQHRHPAERHRERLGGMVRHEAIPDALDQQHARAPARAGQREPLTPEERRVHVRVLGIQERLEQRERHPDVAGAQIVEAEERELVEEDARLLVDPSPSTSTTARQFHGTSLRTRGRRQFITVTRGPHDTLRATRTDGGNRVGNPVPHRDHRVASRRRRYDRARGRHARDPNVSGTRPDRTRMKTPSVPGSRPGWLFAAGATLLVLLKLWLVGAQTIHAIGRSPHDDRMLLELAESILHGRWLGDYTEYTLIKGPFYPIFVAAVFLLGVPLFAAQHLLYSASCGMVVLALRPARVSPALALWLFAALLFNPVSYDAAVLSRVMRQDIVAALSLFIIAGVTGLHFRREEPWRRMLPWSVLLGCSLAAFWLTREDCVWIAPALFLPWIATLWQVVRGPAPGKAARVGVLVMPAALWAGGMLAVAALNWSHYGVFTTCEFRHPSFKAAYRSLVRVKPAEWRQFIPVTRETRERIYKVSPAFAGSRPLARGPVRDQLGDYFPAGAASAPRAARGRRRGLRCGRSAARWPGAATPAQARRRWRSTSASPGR